MRGMSMTNHRKKADHSAASSVASYILALLTLAALCLAFVYAVTTIYVNDLIIGPVLGLVNVVQVLALAMLFLPLRQLYERLLRKVLYVHNYDSDAFFGRLNRTLLSTTDLRVLLQRSSIEIASTLQARQVFFFIHQSDNHYISTGTARHSNLTKTDVADIDEWFRSHQGWLLNRLDLAKDDSLRRMMVSHKLQTIVSLVRSGELIGYLCLGETVHGMNYTIRDEAVLQAISDELVIAIQNALSVQQVRELNDTLQQRIDSATRELRSSNAQLQQLDKAKDEFVSMASHQLRTPLTSVKGYLSMVLEGDAGKISDAQAHLLNEAFTSSERMVHLISDFLNVSRLQTGKFLIDKRPVDLAKVISQELDSLSSSAQSRHLKYLYHPPHDVPVLLLDEDKIRQVIMNFCDNALYYSTEHSTIHVNLVVNKDTVRFEVVNVGIGVPRAEQSQLFTKFYRASNARRQRPDGTGVGLFLAKKVIDAHDGKVLFESVEGKGSTFGFTLPLDELRVRSETDDLKD